MHWRSPATCSALSPAWARLFLTWIEALAPSLHDAVLPAAVACECMAAGYDRIDAVYDQAGDVEIRGLRTHDLPGGITLLLLAQEALAGLSLPAERRVCACAILARAGRRALAGQIKDHELRRMTAPVPSDALAVMHMRSGALVAAPCQCAAVLAGASWRVIALAGRFGCALGCAAQLEDDLSDRVDDAHGGRKTIPTILADLYPDSPDLVEATTWVLMRRFLEEAARALARLPSYLGGDVLWTLLPDDLRMT